MSDILFTQIVWILFGRQDGVSSGNKYFSIRRLNFMHTINRIKYKQTNVKMKIVATVSVIMDNFMTAFRLTHLCFHASTAALHT